MPNFVVRGRTIQLETPIRQTLQLAGNIGFDTSTVPATEIALPQGELYSFSKALGFPGSGNVPNNFALTPSSGALPPNSTLNNFGVFTAGSGVSETLSPVGKYPDLAVNPTAPPIYIQWTSGGVTTVAGPYVINVTQALPAAFTVIKAGTGTQSNYYRLSPLFANNTIRKGDTLRINLLAPNTPRVLYDPRSQPYVTGQINCSCNIVSSTPGVQAIIDCSDFPGWANGGSPLGVRTYDFDLATDADPTVNITDIFVKGYYNFNGNAVNCTCLVTEGMTNGLPLKLGTTRCTFNNGNSSAAPNGPQQNGLQQDQNYSTDTSTWTAIDCEFYGGGSSGGPGHNFYCNHLAVLYAEGCYSHSIRPIANVGHLAKTKAKKTTYHASKFYDDNGWASVACDMAIWGEVLVQGCIIIRDGPNQGNGNAILRGNEWKFWFTNDGRTTSFKCYQNHLISNISGTEWFNFDSCGGAGNVKQGTGGPLPARTRSYRHSYIRGGAGGVECLVGWSTAVTITAGQSWYVKSPPAATGATHWNIYVSAGSASTPPATGTERLQNVDVDGVTAIPIPIGTDWLEPTDGVITTTGRLSATTGLASLVYPDPAWNPDIQDNVLGGSVIPAHNSDPLDRKTYVTRGPTGQWIVSSIPQSNKRVLTADFATTFNNPAAGDYSLKTPEAAVGLDVDGNPYPQETKAYKAPVGTVARTDFNKGAYASGSNLPAWASASNLPPGTWYELQTNKPNDLSSKALTPTPGQYDDWLAFNETDTGTFWQWSGSTLATGYCNYGAVLFYGGGHNPGGANQLNSRILAFRCDTGYFEMAVLPWFEINEIRTSTSATGNAVRVGAGSPTGKVMRWGFGNYYNPFTTIQSDTALATHGEWSNTGGGPLAGDPSAGVPSIGQSYNTTGYMVPCPGMPKGALFIPNMTASTGGGNPAGFYPHWCDLSQSPNVKAQNVWRRFYERAWTPTGQQPPICATTSNTRVPICYSIAQNCEDGIIVSDARGGVGSQVQGKCNISGFVMYGGDGSQFEFCPDKNTPDGSNDIIIAFTGTSPKGPVIVYAKDITIGGTAPVRRVTENYPLGTVGRPQNPIIAGQGLPTRWCGWTYCVDLDCIFMLSVGASNSDANTWNGDARGVVLWKMQFPADRLGGVYVWSSEVLTRSPAQPGLPNDPHDWRWMAQGQPSAGMYSKLRYVPGAKAIVYCHSDSMFPRVFRPAGITP